MRKLGCLLLLSLGFTSLFAGTMPVVQVSKSQNNFIIRMPANPTTGYLWTVKSYDKKYLRFIRKKYSPPTTNKVGAGGVMDFYFANVQGVERPQSTEVELLYARPWEKGSGEVTKVAVVFTKK